MPIYEYQAAGEVSCEYCASSFELIRKASEAELEFCPKCGAPVTRKISAPNVPKSSPTLSPSNIEKAGFTQYRKSGKGVYEKTAGKGPNVISDD